MNKFYTAFYKSEIINENSIINTEGASCLSFELLGTTAALINSVIPLTADKIREFSELPYVIIEQEFTINFNFSATPNNSVLIVKTFYKEV
ncbi:MAG: hypothetical protein WCO13_00665 [Bacteroidota bacterium]